MRFQKKRISDIHGELNKIRIVRELWPVFRCTRHFYNALYADSINASKCTPNQARDRSFLYHRILKSRLNNSEIITSYRTHPHYFAAYRVRHNGCLDNKIRYNRQFSIVIFKSHVKFLSLKADCSTFE